MITSLDALYTELQGIVATATGISTSRVILADQGRPPPEPQGDLYATYRPIPVRAVGYPRVSRTLVDATEDFNETELGTDWQDYEATTISQMELMLSCNFLNGAARDAAWKMHNANFRWPVLERLHTARIGWRKASEIRRLTGIDQAGFQPRYQVDVDLYIEVSITDDVLRANSFALTIEDEAGNVLYDGT